jgi:hypothetical protein
VPGQLCARPKIIRISEPLASGSPESAAPKPWPGLLQVSAGEPGHWHGRRRPWSDSPPGPGPGRGSALWPGRPSDSLVFQTYWRPSLSQTVSLAAGPQVFSTRRTRLQTFKFLCSHFACWRLQDAVTIQVAAEAARPGSRTRTRTRPAPAAAAAAARDSESETAAAAGCCKRLELELEHTSLLVHS